MRKSILAILIAFISIHSHGQGSNTTTGTPNASATQQALSPGKSSKVKSEANGSTNRVIMESIEGNKNASVQTNTSGNSSVSVQAVNSSGNTGQIILSGSGNVGINADNNSGLKYSQSSFGSDSITIKNYDDDNADETLLKIKPISLEQIVKKGDGTQKAKVFVDWTKAETKVEEGTSFATQQINPYVVNILSEDDFSNTGTYNFSASGANLKTFSGAEITEFSVTKNEVKSEMKDGTNTSLTSQGISNFTVSQTDGTTTTTQTITPAIYEVVADSPGSSEQGIIYADATLINTYVADTQFSGGETISKDKVEVIVTEVSSGNTSKITTNHISSTTTVNTGDIVSKISNDPLFDADGTGFTVSNSSTGEFAQTSYSVNQINTVVTDGTYNTNNHVSPSEFKMTNSQDGFIGTVRASAETSFLRSDLPDGGFGIVATSSGGISMESSDPISGASTFVTNTPTEINSSVIQGSNESTSTITPTSISVVTPNSQVYTPGASGETTQNQSELLHEVTSTNGSSTSIESITPTSVSYQLSGGVNNNTTSLTPSTSTTTLINGTGISERHQEIGLIESKVDDGSNQNTITQNPTTTEISAINIVLEGKVQGTSDNILVSTATYAINQLNQEIHITYTGTTNTVFTLPALAGNTGFMIYIYNPTAFTITVNSNAGGTDIWSAGTTVNNIVVAAQSISSLYNNSLNYMNK